MGVAMFHCQPGNSFSRTDILLGKLAKRNRIVLYSASALIAQAKQGLQIYCGWAPECKIKCFYPVLVTILFQSSSFFSAIHLKCDLLDHLHGVVLNIGPGRGHEQLNLLWRPHKIV